MKKLLILFLISSCSIAAFGQAGSPTYGGVFLRVQDSTTYRAAAAAKHGAGYADIYWNEQATTPHFDWWDGSAYRHSFGSGSGSGTVDWGDIGGTLSDQTDLQSAIDAKVAETITNGVQGIAPSQDAVYDALDAKAAKRVSTVAVSGDKTLALSDLYTKQSVSSASDATITIPLQSSVAFQVGDWFWVEWADGAAGQPAVAPVSGSVTIESSSGGLTVPSENAMMYVEYLGSNVWKVQNGLPRANPIASIDLLLSVAGLTATNQPAAAQFFPASAGFLVKFDATEYNYVRFLIRVTTVGHTTARAYPVYDADLNAGIGVTVIGDGTVASGHAVPYTSTGWYETSWIPLPAGAKGDVYFGVQEIGGNAAADPVYSIGVLQFK